MTPRRHRGGAMRNLARTALAAASLLAGAGAANASLSIACQIDDATVSLDLMGSTGHLRGDPMGGVRGSLTIKPAPGWPAVTTPLAAENLTQQWIEGPELRLRLQVLGNDRAREIDLTLTTARVSEDNYRGRYRLTIYHDGKTRTHDGAVACSFGA
jgi:hypothetical protein